MFGRLKLWVAKKLWRLSLRLGVDTDPEMEEALRLMMLHRIDQYGPDFRAWILNTRPVQVGRTGERRFTSEIRSRRV